jgi:diguanylate cyclase (GGDEF)-like protein/putative nucleotidyltransferase with HDIG domain
MSVKARSYILGVILTGTALSALALPSLATLNSQWPLLLILVTLTTLAHLFVSMGIGNDAWAINLVFLFAGVVLLQPFEFVILVVVPHLIEWAADVWVKKSARLRNWYIQPFNIAAHLISGFAARGAYVSLTLPETPLFAPTAFLAAMSAVIVYVGLNHLLIAVALMLARGRTLRQTGMFELGNLFGDLVQISLGYLWAVLWNLNPWLMLPVLAPLIVIYRALTIPKLKQDAQTDAKTGLFNAHYSAESLAAEFEKARRSRQSLSVIMADLDLLRSINNTYGHLAGDTVLIGVARVIRETAGDSGIAGRFGGEEFSVILPRLTEAEARAVAERMRQAVEQVEFQVDNHSQPIHVTLSLGVAEYSTDIPSAKDLVHEADIAVYQAKLQGRNRVVCASAVPRSVKLESQASDARLESPYVAAFTPRPAVAEATGVVTNAQPEAQSRSQTAPAPANPVVPSRSAASGRLMLFVGCVIVAGLVTAALGLRLDSPMDYWAMVLFALLAGLAELFQMDLYGDGSISVSLAISFAAALVAGIPGVIATSAVITLVHALRRRSALYKTAFNWSNHVLAALAPVLLIRVQGITLQISNLLLLSVLAGLAALVYFGIETGLIASAIGLSEKRSPVAVWQDQYRWLLPYYLLLGLMGAFLSLAYITLGVLGVLVFTFPILMMRFAQKQYIDRTQESVRELKRMNRELTLANNEIASASRAIRQLNDELFLTLSKIIDARDPHVAGHAAKVADYAVAIGADLGLKAERLESLRQGGLLHDIGKLGISEDVLHKPARLADGEYTYVKTHTTLGAEFLETCHGLRHLAPFIRHHHEWWDGNGYPDHLKGEQIPLEARILAVCDAVEAMASDRPYHRGMALSEIMVELQRCAGTQFDPAVVQVFMRIAERRGVDFITNSAQEAARQQAALQDGRS